MRADAGVRHRSRAPVALVLGAIGVVFGDIGTSPLYALQTAFGPEHGIPLHPDNVMGILSLIVWSMTWVITIKYLFVMMRADNNGEGGILALLALALRETRRYPRLRWTIIGIGIFGAAMFYGDSMITPAISVLSRGRGPGSRRAQRSSHFVIPIALGVLAILFLIQSHGTAKVGAFFGPVMVVWFLAIGALGVYRLARQSRGADRAQARVRGRFPARLPAAGLPRAGRGVPGAHRRRGALCGHGPLRQAPDPHRMALPGVPGAAAQLLRPGRASCSPIPRAIANPFYRMVPEWAMLPMVVLATCAAVIASQAVISGAFSVTRQAIQLGYVPRLEVLHTSERAIGQIYVPFVNWMLFIAVVIAGDRLRQLDDARQRVRHRGRATMVIECILAMVVARLIWKWSMFMVVAS